MTGDVTTVAVVAYLYQVLPKPSSPRQWILFNADVGEEVSLLRNDYFVEPHLEFIEHLNSMNIPKALIGYLFLL